MLASCGPIDITLNPVFAFNILCLQFPANGLHCYFNFRFLLPIGEIAGPTKHPSLD